MTETIGSPEPNRTNIEAMKSVVKDSGVLLMEEGEEKDSLADRVLEEALDIRGVDDINGLLAATDNRNINQRAVQTKIDDFGVAVAECIQELGDEGRELKEALIAGSFSLREKLPEAWSIDSTDQSGNDVSLSTLIYDASVTTSSRATKLAIIQETEWIDYRVTHRDTGVTLNEEVNNAIRELDALGKKSFNNSEREVIRKKLDYLKGLKTPVRTDYRSEQTVGNSENEETEDGRSTQSFDYVRPEYNKDTGEWEGGSRWELSPEFTAEAMKWMDHAMRWTSYTPPEWFKELPVALQAKIEYMVAVNGAAANLLYAKKDLDKIMSNDAVFGFTHEQLNALFDDDFKLVYSRMLHDLCELGVQTTDQNGVKCLRYKERYYAFDYKAKDGDGEFLKGSDGGRKIIPETEENLGKGVRTIDVDVFSKIKDIKGYEEQLALFLANYKQKEADNLAISQGKAKRDADGVWQVGEDGNFILDRNRQKMFVDTDMGVWEVYKRNVFEGKKLIHKKGEYVLDDEGNRKAGYLCKMNAYTAYNFFYAMGDASLSDRKRILPTFNGVISDAIRTLNPEYKARSKWQVEKSGQARHLSEKDFLVESEYFGGPVGRYILTVAKLERDIGRPIDGKKTIMQKIYDGELAPFPDKTYYGFGDFFNTSRDLELESGVDRDIGFSFNELMMRYGRFEGDDFIRDEKGPKFRFKSKSSTTFENEFFDSLDAAILVNRSIMGKEKVDSIPDFGAKITSAFGMVNGIWVGKEENKRRLFSYTRSPEIWRSVVIGAFGADYTKLSSDYIPISRTSGASYLPYNLFVSDILTDNQVGLGINPNEINVNKLMRMLGVDIDPGMIVTPNVIKALKSSSFDREERLKTTNLKLEQQKKSYKGETTDDMRVLLAGFNEIKSKSASEDYKRMVIDFERAVEFEDLSYAKRLLEAMREF